MTEQTLFTPIGNKNRLVDRVVAEIRRLILEQKLEPGTRLPPERDLAKLIGVSRPVVREAIQMLAAKGLLEIRHGMGTLVRQVDSAQIAEPLFVLLQTRGFTLDHLHQVRITLEVEIAALAAAGPQADDLRRLGEIVDRMEAVVDDPQAYAEADEAFHRDLAEMSGNPLLVLLLDSIADLVREVRLSVARSIGSYIAGLPDHRAILERVAAGDIPGARQAMQQHLARARWIQKTNLE